MRSISWFHVDDMCTARRRAMMRVNNAVGSLAYKPPTKDPVNKTHRHQSNCLYVNKQKLTHGSSAQQVNRDPLLLERHQNPDVREPPRTPARQHQPHALPSQRTRQPRGVRGGEAVRGRPRGVVMSVDAEKKTPLVELPVRELKKAHLKASSHGLVPVGVTSVLLCSSTSSRCASPPP